MNTHPLHFDTAYAAQVRVRQPLVNSCLTLSMVVGMSVSDVSQKAIGNLGWNDIRLTAPVFVGDTIYAESEVLAKRESASRPRQGLVTVRTIGRKADGTRVHELRAHRAGAEARPRGGRPRRILNYSAGTACATVASPCCLSGRLPVRRRSTT